ncbi:MAG: hypothetical protein GX382_04925 [Syntrophomonadaceae bacterium]|nr:hypothetical protein [Syntrophomonadaceae bacterium]
MNQYCAVVMDVISIQKYIYSSNELRNNLGASHIVKTLFEDLPVSALAEVCNLKEEEVQEIIVQWRDNPTKIMLDDDPSLLFEIGVSGGGKALLLFRERDVAERFVKKFTNELLFKAPGIQLAVGIMAGFSPTQEFPKQLEKLYAQMTDNRNRYFPVTTLPAHSITATNSEGETMSTYYNKDVEKYMDHKTAAKQVAEEEARKKLKRDYAELLKCYSFTTRVDQLGQEKGDSYTAIVHIDGNGIGNWFQQSGSLADYRIRSINMERITEQSFRKLITEVVNMLDKLKGISGFEIKDNLPLRPLILGGDDLTFMCHGKLGLYLAERFIKIWTQTANQELEDLPAEGFSACAGVAIAKTKYPFYRTYQIAEELCALAKECHRDEGGSWMDFYIVSGTKSGSVQSIREAEGKDHDYQLYFGPYVLDNPEHEKATTHLLDGLWRFYKDTKYWTNPHLKELRAAFYAGPEALNTFLIDMAARGGSLPKHESARYSSRGYTDGKSPYPDMIEIMEFYPREILSERRESIAKVTN